MDTCNLEKESTSFVAPIPLTGIQSHNLMSKPK